MTPIYRAVVVLLVSLAATGCQLYEQLDADLTAYQAQWAERAPDAESVSAYARALAELDPRATAYDPSDGLTLAEAEIVCLVFNPALRAARAEAEVPLAGARQAGHWDDPSLDVDLLRVVESVEQPWILGGSLGITIPLSGRTRIARLQASHEGRAALRKAALTEWTTLGELRAAWANWSATTQQITLLSGYLAQLEAIRKVAAAQRKFGKIGATDERQFEIEYVTRTGELAVARQTERAQRQALKRLLGLVPEASLTLLPGLSGDAPPAVDLEALRATNLRLLVASDTLAVADAAYQLALRKQWPDLTLGPAGEREEGEYRVGAVISLPIPLFNRNRQEIATARAARRAAHVALEAEYEAVVGELAEARASIDAAVARRTYLEQQLAPLLDRQNADLARLAGLGQLDAVVTLEALKGAYEVKQAVLEARVAEVLAADRLRRLTGELITPTQHRATTDAPHTQEQP